MWWTARRTRGPCRGEWWGEGRRGGGGGGGGGGTRGEENTE